ncbi:MAG TPA: NAD-dependent epimerase/dehydratase family protein [Egibacteraceae bacterium]|nr:NAD-dependent epimerase/dehydratase family protein [Egibacteraceae bacterium]
MRALVLGGTSFVGRHIVHAARAAGMTVTLFNRGRTNPGLFSDVERIHGDRERDLDALADRRWDAVIDVNGYVPRIVGLAADALADRCEHYTFISTIAVYGDVGATAPDEDVPVAELDTPTERVTADTYGALKAACEDVVRQRFGDRALVVRPGLVVGPHDPTERFVRWVRRAAEGGEMLAPGDPDGPVQFIDGRDLGDWVVRMVLASAAGTFNATGPHPAVTFGQLLQTCTDVAGAGTALEWVAEAFLLDHEVQPWTDLPLWLPADANGMSRTVVDRAIAAGLTFRSLQDTVRATLLWDQTRADRRPAGMPLDRERELLAAWEEHRRRR